MDIPGTLIAAQRAMDEAWADVEAYRRGVDARRREESPDDPDRPAWQGRALRRWTDAEDARFAELYAAAVEATARRREVMAAEGLTSWGAERAVREAARGESA